MVKSFYPTVHVLHVTSMCSNVYFNRRLKESDLIVYSNIQYTYRKYILLRFLLLADKVGCLDFFSSLTVMDLKEENNFFKTVPRRLFITALQ